MVKDFQIKGLEKLVNSSAIKDIYPMVDHIEIRCNGNLGSYTLLDIDIFINDPFIKNMESMYDADLDPHYLVDYHIKNYLNYFSIDKVIMNFIVWGPDGNIVYSWKH